MIRRHKNKLKFSTNPKQENCEQKEIKELKDQAFQEQLPIYNQIKVVPVLLLHVSKGLSFPFSYGAPLPVGTVILLFLLF